MRLQRLKINVSEACEDPHAIAIQDCKAWSTLVGFTGEVSFEIDGSAKQVMDRIDRDTSRRHIRRGGNGKLYTTNPIIGILAPMVRPNMLDRRAWRLCWVEKYLTALREQGCEVASPPIGTVCLARDGAQARYGGTPQINDGIAALAQLRKSDGGWGYTEITSQTDVDDTSHCVEFLRLASPERHRDVLTRAEDYLTGMADPGGGFPSLGLVTRTGAPGPRRQVLPATACRASPIGTALKETAVAASSEGTT
ncbi:MAG: hypothetical protein ACRDRW_07560 [Pseudonocardiaceae bacterium]